MDHSLQKPDIFKYFDFRLYLSDILNWFRTRDPDFTFQKLSETCGLNSRSHFIDITNGRKLTKKFLPVYLKICELKEKEAEYFKALVFYDQSLVSEDKREHFKIISAFSTNLDIVKLEGEIYQYFEHWFIPAMLSMVNLHRNERDHRVLAKYFNPLISAVQARKAIKILTKLGMIYWDADKIGWIITRKQFQCSSDAQLSALKGFHRQVQKLGIAACDANIEGQTFSCQTLGVSMQLRNKIDEMIGDLRKKILDQVNKDTAPEVVLQINFQTFYLSNTGKKHSDEGS
jgi:uncharacterized protein (TIGR02147 family)